MYYGYGYLCKCIAAGPYKMPGRYIFFLKRCTFFNINRYDYIKGYAKKKKAAHKRQPFL